MSTVNQSSTGGTLSPSASNANTTAIAAAQTTTSTSAVAAASSTSPTVALLFQLNNLFERNENRIHLKHSHSEVNTMYYEKDKNQNSQCLSKFLILCLF